MHDIDPRTCRGDERGLKVLVSLSEGDDAKHVQVKDLWPLASSLQAASIRLRSHGKLLKISPVEQGMAKYLVYVEDLQGRKKAVPTPPFPK